MKIKQVSARNFRTLVEFDHHFLTGFCPISGKNNAGKSCVIRIFQHFLQDSDEYYYHYSSPRISFLRDRTQWTDDQYMSVGICLAIDRRDDSETFFFLDKFSSKSLEKDSATLKIQTEFDGPNSQKTTCWLDGDELDGKTSVEVARKLTSSSNLVVDNSTSISRRSSIFSGGFTELVDAQIDEKDRQGLKDAETRLRNKVGQIARKQKAQLTELIGRLKEDYEVNLTTVDRFRQSTVPIAITLLDKQVEVPLNEWGSGTRNRTEVLMSLMEAARIKEAATMENRTTPIVVLEEPESFLHPHAQAEFGKLLAALSSELEIQIIATTHSPYLLNHAEPRANTLLARKISRSKLQQTEVVDTSGDNWMQPFSEILGIIPAEFASWKSIIGASTDSAILVEGIIDKEYFEFFKENYPAIYNISDEVLVEEYGGKDALRNTAMLRFVNRRFKRMFVTFDLDAESDVRRSLDSIGFAKSVDYLPIGLSRPGAQCIEGIVPSSIKSKVYSDNVDLVDKLNSADRSERKSAKNSIKRKILEELRNQKPDEEELVEFKKLFTRIGKALKRTK